MVQIRILAYLAPRISQMLGWSFDTSPLVDPLLKHDKIPTIQKEIGETFAKVHHKFYQPPPYIPPKLPKLSS